MKMVWLLVPDRLVGVFPKLLIRWDFPTQASSGFRENGPKERKYPLSGRSLGENDLLIAEVRRELLDYCELMEK